jgi:hypothetical protein
MRKYGVENLDSSYRKLILAHDCAHAQRIKENYLILGLFCFSFTFKKRKCNLTRIYIKKSGC